MPNYNPKGTYYALRRIRRSASCINGRSSKAEGTEYVEAAELDDKGNPVSSATTFTMADRTPEQIEQLVNMRVIAPVPSK
jgi:hypothetical protein